MTHKYWKWLMLSTEITIRTGKPWRKVLLAGMQTVIHAWRQETDVFPAEHSWSFWPRQNKTIAVIAVRRPARQASNLFEEPRVPHFCCSTIASNITFWYLYRITNDLAIGIKSLLEESGWHYLHLWGYSRCNRGKRLVLTQASYWKLTQPSTLC